ncbi:fungal specific transcription factor [Beauveria bassiana ARSEF 2860]|uniref:Fungal specific transcription factor n=1 Tax=Beauveria bassiana (strain ARSEF 2860) TaxID=655819 RepID=J4WFD0_BEAB2|nr:fungal specific transcription factor [Beauveria bassiana ARSEF 2860]EJP68660.1 fungal specific transcription factor [Beauveria bassiana ARSEF 2860]
MDFSLDGKALLSVPPQKRSRVLLSCAPCRASKLKCDRSQPCSQCAKKDRPAACVYAPKPVKRKPPPKGMSARLKRLEGMVRNMMEAEAAENAAEGGKKTDGEEEEEAAAAATDAHEAKTAHGQVVRSVQGSTYVGATHCLAMLEDIEDMKTYFDDEDDEVEGDSPGRDLEAAEILLSPRGGPGSRDELIGNIPEKYIADRLIMRYFSSASPSQFCVHRPTFTKNANPDSASLPWIAQLFMILALGVIFNYFSSPEELRAESTIPVLQRIQTFRSCAGWALVWSKYTNPTSETIPAFVLYVEAYFLFSRAAQMSCYTLSAVCLRLMLKLGMHRDPSGLADLSPYEGEMRRRWWSMACQIELLVSFHMGLPSMLHGIESDVEIHGNYQDEDFGEETEEMPAPRSLQDYTSLSYSINKTKILRVFGRIARQAHALTPPSYTDTMRLDVVLNATWDEVPPFLRVKPLDQCIGDAPMLLIQRYGIEALYHKCRCVLHRRHLAEPVPRAEHDYARQQCLEAAVALLDIQVTIWNATRPGSMLSMCGWFVTSLSVHDFMLAAMVIYVAARSAHYPEHPTGSDARWAAPDVRLRSKEELRMMLRRSHAIWCRVSSTVGELRKTRDTLAIMLAKLGCPVDGESYPTAPPPKTTAVGGGMSMMVPPPLRNETRLGQQVFTPAAPPPSLLSSGQLSSVAASTNHAYSGSEPTTGFHADRINLGTMMSTDFSSFDLPLVGDDPTVVTFPGPEGTSFGGDATGKGLSAPEDSGDSIFGTVEFDSSWMDDGMDWLDVFSANNDETSAWPEFGEPNEYLRHLAVGPVRVLGKNGIGLAYVKHGSYNVCYFVTFPADGTEWVVRIPISPLISDVWAKVQSEVATMQYVQRETRIPVPTVHGYGHGERLTADPSTLQAFLILEKMPGESLHSHEISAIPKESRIFFFAQLGDILGQLQQLHFPRSGSLYPDSKSSGKFTIGNPLYVIGNDNAVNVGVYEKSSTTFSNAFDAVKGMFPVLEHAYEIPISDEVPDQTIKRELFAIDSLASSLSDNTHPFWSLDAPFMLSHGDLRCENIMVDENMKITAIIDWEWVVILPQQLCTPPTWVFGQNYLRDLHNREIFQEFQSAITQDNAYHEYLQYWRSNVQYLPLAQILRHPELLVNIYYTDVFPRLHSEPFSAVEASFFADEEHRKKFQERLTVAERYNEYLKENDLYVVDEVWKSQQEWIEKADKLLAEVNSKLAAYKSKHTI